MTQTELIAEFLKKLALLLTLIEKQKEVTK
jgi:hypothetical protein